MGRGSSLHNFPLRRKSFTSSVVNFHSLWWAVSHFTLRRNSMKLRTLCCVFILCLSGGLQAAAQQVAPDATPVGPLPTASGEYDLGAQIDTLVLPGCQPTSGYDCKVD